MALAPQALIRPPGTFPRRRKGDCVKCSECYPAQQKIGTPPMRYPIVIEKTATGFSAFVPDRPGCIETGGDKHEVESEIESTIRISFQKRV